MAKDNLTPEEQLLKIIENPSAQGSSKDSGRSGKKGGSSFKLPSLGRLKGIFSYMEGELRKKFFKKGSLRVKLDLHLVNRILIGVTGALGIFLAVNLAFFRGNPEKIFALESEIPNLPSVETKTFQPKPLSYYKEATQRRNLFGPVEATKVATPAGPGEEKPAQQASRERQIDILTKGLKLVGISWGTDPQAMIEDTVSHRTYFVRPGQSIDRVQVRGVFRDRVVLSYEDQEKELF